MDNRYFKAAKFAYELRTNIFKEHFGEFYKDPIKDY